MDEALELGPEDERAATELAERTLEDYAGQIHATGPPDDFDEWPDVAVLAYALLVSRQKQDRLSDGVERLSFALRKHVTEEEVLAAWDAVHDLPAQTDET